MADLRARARVLAIQAIANIGRFTDSNTPPISHQKAITDAILRGMVEALEAEPDEGMMTEAYACSGISIKAMWRAMAAARAREIKEGK